MDFKEHLKKYLSSEFIDDLIASFSLNEHKGLFINTRKISDDEFIKKFPALQKHPIVPHCYLYNKDEFDAGKNIYHELGLYYIQDPSASLVPYFLNPKGKGQILDMCAAPGGKSIMTSLLCNEEGIIYANDISSSRVQHLLSNIERLGISNIVVLNKDLSKIKNLENRFDAIILDAPCSGSGMFRRSEEMKNDWSYEKVTRLSKIQKELILLAYSFLKEGGKLIYSTCSYSYEEDEEVVFNLLKNSDAKLLPLPENDMFYRSKEMKEAIHLFPNRFVGEGHFIALITKPGELKSDVKKEEKQIIRKSQGKGTSSINNYFKLFYKGYDDLINLSIRPGLFVKSEISNKVIYSHHYSHYIDDKSSIHVSLSDAKKYILGEEINIDDDKDYNFIAYEKYNISSTQNRFKKLKNIYPKGLRKQIN